LEGIMEAPRGPRTVASHPRDYRGAHLNSPNIGQIPCGTNGGSGLGGCSTCGPRGPATGMASPMPGSVMPTAVAPVPMSNELPTAQPLPVGETSSGQPPVAVPQAVPASAPGETGPTAPPLNIGPATNRDR